MTLWLYYLFIGLRRTGRPLQRYSRRSARVETTKADIAQASYVIAYRAYFTTLKYLLTAAGEYNFIFVKIHVSGTRGLNSLFCSIYYLIYNF